MLGGQPSASHRDRYIRNSRGRLTSVEFIGQRLRLSASDKRFGGVGGEGASNFSMSANETFNKIAAYLALYDNVSDVEFDARLHGI